MKNKTKRELKRIMKDTPNIDVQEVAADYLCSVATVRSYRRAFCEKMKCLNCNRVVWVAKKSYEHTGVLNVFCNNEGECEDLYSQKQ